MNLQHPITQLQSPAGRPRLAGSDVPEKPLSLFKAVKVAKQNVVAMVPRIAYREPFWRGAALFGGALLVSEPAAIKRILLDNVANYPKADMERDILGAAFGEGLLVSEGEKWRSHRRIMSPAFDYRSLVSYTPAMTEHATLLREDWAARQPGAVIDIAAEMTRLTLDIVARTMFSADAGEMAGLIGETMQKGQEQLVVSLLDLVPVIGKWHMAGMMKRVHATFSALDAAMYRLIDARAKAPSSAPRDLLDRLIAARDGETGVSLTDKEVRDEVVIIFLAGHETTAVALTFVWYLLSQHPLAEARLHAELDAVLAGRAPTHADLPNLPYTRMVIEEAMRLYPPAPGMATRVALQADELSGRSVKKGQMIVIMPWVLHRHEALWDDPLRFDPDRFTPERSAARTRFAYLPFGGGPRICIGAQLAMIEASLILATLAQRFRLRLAPGPEIELLARITLRPRGGMPMILEKRESGR